MITMNYQIIWSNMSGKHDRQFDAICVVPMCITLRQHVAQTTWFLSETSRKTLLCSRISKCKWISCHTTGTLTRISPDHPPLRRLELRHKWTPKLGQSDILALYTTTSEIQQIEKTKHFEHFVIYGHTQIYLVMNCRYVCGIDIRN